MNKRILLLLFLFFAGLSAKAQLVINELSQGNGDEYVEFVVMGTRTCTDSTFDLRNWIFDDNPGWYGAGAGQGIAQGCMRFRNVANWAAVPYGSIIIVYNSTSRNVHIPADDPTDANHDYVYIVPDNSTLLQQDNSHPPGGNASTTTSYATANTFINGGDWATVSLNNSADAFHTISPSSLTTAYHSIAFGSSNRTAANVSFPTTSGTTVYYLTSSLYNTQAAWVAGTAGAVTTDETPGLPNGGANTSWINGMRVQITAPVIGTVTITQPSCAGNNGSLTLNGLTANTTYNVSYSLNGNPVNGLVITSNATGQVIIPNLSAGTYTNITVAIGLCSNTKTGSYVLVNAGNPAPPVASSNSPVCTGSTLNLSTPVVTGATYSWTGPNGFTANTAAPTISNVTAAAAGTYKIILTVGGCTSTPDSTTVVVNPTPAKPTASATSVCAGQTLNLSATSVPGATYSWTGPGGFTSNVQNPSRTGANVAMSGYYGVVATVGGCSSARDSVEAIIKPIPTSTVAGSNSPVCVGETINLMATNVPGGVSYTWSGPVGYTANVQNPSFTATSTSGGTYGVKTTLNGCSSPEVFTTVVVNPGPIVSNITTTAPAVCGGNGQLNLSTLIPNTAYQVTYTKNGAPVTQTITTSASGILQIIGTAGIYTNIVVKLGNCSSTPAGPYTIADPSAPPAPGAFSNSPICEGAQLQLTSNGNAGATYQWSGPNGFSSNAITPAIPNATLAATGTYRVTQTVNGCTSAADSVLVTAIARPAAPTAGSNSPVCAGDALNLTASTIAGVTYAWTGPNGYTSSTQNPSFTATASSGGTYSVIASVNGCSSPAGTTTVVVNPRPVITNVAGANPTTCGGINGSIVLSGLVPNASYTITYQKNGVPVTATFVASAGNGTITIASLAAGTYAFTSITNSAGCAAAPVSSVTLSDPSAPAAPTITSNSPVCAGATILLSASGATGATFLWSGPGSFTASTAAVTIAGATTANGGTYTVIQSVNGCTSSAFTTVVVNPSPVIAAATGTDPSGCATATGSILLTGLEPNTAYTISYSRNGVPATIQLTSNASGNITIANLTAATYSGITAALGNCTSASAGPVTLADPNGPAAPTAANNGPLCSGATLNLTASTIAGATYSWVGPNGYSSSAQNPSITNTTVANSGNYIVTVRVGNCSSAPATTTAVVNQTPTAPVITSNSPVCVGNTLTLSAASSPGATYSWSGPNGFTSGVQSPNISNVTTAANGIYTVTAQLGTCTSQSVSQTITVVPIPGAPVAITPVVYCQDATAAPLSAAGTNLRFYTTATGGTGVTSLVPATTTPGTFNYYVSQSTNGCEGPRTTIVVTVNPKPAPPVTATSITYCQFSPASQLTATGTGVQWFATRTGNSPLSAAPTPSTLVPGTFNYYVSQKAGNCESDRIEVTVVVLPKPAPPGVQSPLYLCQYDTLQLTADGQNLLWYLHPTGGGGMPFVVPNTGNVDSFFYYVTQTVNGCESDRTRLQVFVNYKPNGIIVPSRPWLCAEDTISFTYYGNARLDAEYNWKSPSPESHYVSGGGVGPYVVQYDVPGEQYIELTINNKGCISDVFRLPVTVRPLPKLTFVMKPEACVNEPVDVALSGITSGIDRYDWNFSNGKIIYNTATGGPYGITWDAPGTKVVSVIATSAMCGSKAYRDTIEIHPNPDAHISRAGNASLCTGDSVELSVVNEPGSTYMWSPYQFFTDRARQASTVFATPNLSGNVSVIVTSSKGCSSADSIYIDMKPCCEVFFPNAFSPNNDTKNDFFRPVTVGHHDIATFRVFNRWGQVVYESKDERKGWDGSFNGKEQELGTYYYYFKYRCSNSGDYLEQKGEFLLIR